MAQILVDLDEYLYQAISHNPEAEGSSPSSATKKTLETQRFQGFFLCFRKGRKTRILTLF